MNKGSAPNRFTAEWGPWTQKMIPPQRRDEAHGMLSGGRGAKPHPAWTSREFRGGDNWSRSLRQERELFYGDKERLEGQAEGRFQDYSGALHGYSNG